ncbi:MAG: outer membrane beta-barrel protein [Verrucomicrobiota bacterium]|jgi:opacity protein-like surface antigen
MKLQDIKNSKLAVVGAAALFAACATTIQAGDASPGFYMSTDAGLNMITGIRGEHSEVRLDPGMRWGLEAGYRFKLADQLTLGVEAESGAMWNSLSSIKNGGAETELGGNTYQIPILANVIVNYQLGKWTPYVGLGGGLDYISVNLWSRDGQSHPGAGSDFGPAMQGQAGVRYQLSEKTELGLGYKYLTAFSEKLGNDGRLSEVNNHTVDLSFTYHF